MVDLRYESRGGSNIYELFTISLFSVDSIKRTISRNILHFALEGY